MSSFFALILPGHKEEFVLKAEEGTSPVILNKDGEKVGAFDPDATYPEWPLARGGFRLDSDPERAISPEDVLVVPA